MLRMTFQSRENSCPGSERLGTIPWHHCLIVSPESYFSTSFKETEGKLGRCLPVMMPTHHTVLQLSRATSSMGSQHANCVGPLLVQCQTLCVFGEAILWVTVNLTAASRGTELLLGSEQATLGIISGPCTGRSCGEVERQELTDQRVFDKRVAQKKCNQIMEALNARLCSLG